MEEARRPQAILPNVPRSKDWSLLEREIEAINRFPGQNPNPVLRLAEDGRLTYANDAAAPIVAAWRANVGEKLGDDLVDALRSRAGRENARLEVVHGSRTFAIIVVHVPDLGVYNLYGIDITAAKVVERFPARNPNPVLRLTPSGVLRYANDASQPITNALEIGVGDALPANLMGLLNAQMADSTTQPPEVPGEGGRTYRLTPVPIPEFDFVNVYGTDITAEKAIDEFPNQNPNPVLRLSKTGRMTYANPASVPVQKALSAEVGEMLDPGLFARIIAATENAADPTLELQADGRLYRLRVVAVSAFDSINLYGTDITAARQVERLNAENEALLLNILPRSIAERLRGGETVIADRFDDMAVLFADLVGFTELSSRLPPNDVVKLLNDVFTMCDRLVDRFGLEKIKTVGDAYMVVGGLPPGDRHAAQTHAEDVARMGLTMLAELPALGASRAVPLQARVGMHVGPAVAGVIGLKKFIYDVWGDTVNTASRMESTGAPGRLHVSAETAARLRERFIVERRGMVDVKGKGVIETWFVVRER